MKNIKRILALVLVLVTVFALVPSVFAEEAPKTEVSMMKTDYTLTVDQNTEFKFLGLPTNIPTTVHGMFAKVTWDKGNYDKTKLGTYKFTGKAVAEDDAYVLTDSKVTATVKVIDAPFGLAPLSTMKSRIGYKRPGRLDAFKYLCATPVVEGYEVQQYSWSYRWFKSNDPDKGFKFYSDKRYCPLSQDDRSAYYYCKVTGTRDGKSFTMTTNTAYICGFDFMRFEIECDKESIKPGESFTIRGAINMYNVDGTFEEIYVTTKFPQTLQFKSNTEGVTPDPAMNNQVIMAGETTCEFKTNENALKNVDEIEVAVRFFGDLSQNWFMFPGYDETTTMKIKVEH